MSRITNAQIMEALTAMNSRFDSIESRLSALETAKQSTTAPKKTKSSSKKSAPKKTKSSSKKPFDRPLYEATAKKLGVFNAKYGKVTATVENGRVIRSAVENREMVYKAMGLN